MTQAANLDRQIQLKHEIAGSPATDAYGQSLATWTAFATVYAAVTQQSGREFMQAPGLESERKVIFRIRWRSDVVITNRVAYGGRDHDINEVREIGRKQWLDLFTTAVG